MCPWYTDCQQLRDETSADIVVLYSVRYTSSTIHYTILVLYYHHQQYQGMTTMYAIPVVQGSVVMGRTSHTCDHAPDPSAPDS